MKDFKNGEKVLTSWGEGIILGRLPGGYYLIRPTHWTSRCIIFTSKDVYLWEPGYSRTPLYIIENEENSK